MPCSKDKKRKKPKKGWFVCEVCGQARKDKDKLCEPIKFKKWKKLQKS